MTDRLSSQWMLKYNGCLQSGEVPEWTIGAVSKTVVALGATEGSNPSLSVFLNEDSPNFIWISFEFVIPNGF